MKEQVLLFTAYLETPVGPAELTVSDSGVRSLTFGKEGISKDKHPMLDKAMLQVEEYFESKRTNFDLELDVQGTDFQKMVWKQLIKIPFGRTVSYQKIANDLDNPGAVRAVGNANGKNKLAIIIPCHRVIGEDGSLTGYAGGLDRKLWLLNFEKNVIQPKLF